MDLELSIGNNHKPIADVHIPAIRIAVLKEKGYYEVVQVNKPIFVDLKETKKIIFTAQSKHLFYARMLVCRYALEHGTVPLNPFNIWGYFLYELVDRNLVRRGNNNIIRIVDELWVFGQIADGVLEEIDLAIELMKPVRFFSAGPRYEDIRPIRIIELEFEESVLAKHDAKEIIDRIAKSDFLTKS